jgi:ATP-dependent Clp protease ATP-binding subunit ClpA
MFERFTQRARHVVVLAQEEARLLDHNYIGTEHVLLGLLQERQGIAGIALTAAGLTLEAARADVEAKVGRGKGKNKPKGHIPFTPRAKKVLELSLREALQLRHNYIGTEHILLGIMREGDGLAANILRQHGIDFLALRMRVLDLVPIAESPESRRLRRWLRPRGSTSRPEFRTTSAIEAGLDEAHRIAGDAAVGSHHLLLATLGDPMSAAAKALTGLGVDLDAAREALRQVDIAGTTDELPEEAGRRQLVMTLTDHDLRLETTDSTLLDAARTALAAVATAADADPSVISGRHPMATGFAEIWQAWNLALRQICEGARRGDAAPEEDAETPDDASEA